MNRGTSQICRVVFLSLSCVALLSAVTGCGPAPMQSRSSERQKNVCTVYAKEAVAQNQSNLDRRCGFSGGRWTSDYAGHFRWCMGVDITYSVGEMARRNEMLAQQCVSAQARSPAQVPTGWPEPGRAPTPETGYSGEPVTTTVQTSDWTPLDDLDAGVDARIASSSGDSSPSGDSFAQGELDFGPTNPFAVEQEAGPFSDLPSLSSEDSSQDLGLPPPRPAEPGRYETTTTAIVRSAPASSAPIVARLPRGTVLNVTGSEHEWLVVYSRKRGITAYVRREEAMFSPKQTQKRATSDEGYWEETERRIREVIMTWGISNVQVTFIADTAYLKGNVETDRDRERAELAARSLPEVRYVTNWIRVSP